MAKTQSVPMSDLHLNPGGIVNQVHYTLQPVVVTKHGKPVVILVPVIGVLDGGDNVIGAIRRWLDSLEQPAQTWEQREVEKPIDTSGTDKPGGWD